MLPSIEEFTRTSVIRTGEVPLTIASQYGGFSLPGVGNDEWPHVPSGCSDNENPGSVLVQEMVCDRVPLGHKSLNDSPPLFNTPQDVDEFTAMIRCSPAAIIDDGPTK